MFRTVPLSVALCESSSSYVHDERSQEPKIYLSYCWGPNFTTTMTYPRYEGETTFNPLALELDLYSLAHHLCKK